MPNMNQNQMPNNLQMNIANLEAPRQNADFNLANSNPSRVNSNDGDEKIDFAKRLEDMQKERDYDTGGAADQMDEFNKQNSQINVAGQDALQERNSVQTENKNEFFKKLADKNKNTDMSDTRARDSELFDMNSSNLQKSYMDTGGFEIDDSAYSAYEDNKLQLGTQNASQAREISTTLENNIRDSTRLLNGGENSGISELIKEREGEINKDKSKEYIDNTFLSTNFQYERRKRKMICLDISDNLLDLANGNDSTKSSIDNISNTYWGKFRLHLAETLVIDKLSDVFIESIIVNNPAQASRFSNLYMVIDIEEFNIKMATNNTRMMDKFVLPNENTDSSGSTKIMKYHLKSNYVATVNPIKLNTLTFNITNEDGDSVQTQFNTSTRKTDDVSNVGTTTAIAIDDDDADDPFPFLVLDAVYNSSQQFIGNVGALVNGAADSITFTRPTNVHLHSGETLFFPSSRTTLTVNEVGGVLIGDATITVNADPTTIFSVGDTVYIGTGAAIGKVSSRTATTITFEKGVTQYIPNGVALYNANPLPCVFASNEKSNRIILELVIMSR